MNKDFLLLQINDALFPIGSYTHSFGLESFIQAQEVKDASSALSYLEANLYSPFLTTELLSLKLAYSYAKQNDLNAIFEIEELVCVSTSPMELRLANQKLGNRFLKTINTLSLPTNDLFQSYLKASVFPTHSSAYGVFCACVGLELSPAISHYLYAQSSNMVTNCVKTIPLSQNDGQKILLALHATFEAIKKKLDTLDLAHLCVSSIHNDIKAMQHEVLYSRLYMS
ncbi:urease accessory protein UreF [Helicobacter sp. 11S02596-1]|uniref:urease accessory protein UreF n=1 Tax=Helicobacter sp. 11S02596-1 TaxID=1476194 RepID=UPI000BA6E97B|nr:urease accessory protein UreF [Helicobacter sp. 11S02596-1]PAF43244.1 urease accessory protein UreF [Helicobacter sp. 11S02596-1]